MKRVIFTGFTLPDTIDEAKAYEVQAILGRRIVEKKKRNKIIEKLEYLVKWRGWESKHNNWVPWFDFNGVEMIRDFEQKLSDDSTSFKSSRNGKGPWRPLPNYWKLELDRCHQLYLAKVRASLAKESVIQNLDSPLIEHTDDTDIQCENYPQQVQGSTDGIRDNSSTANYENGIQMAQQSNTAGIQDTTVATLPPTDDRENENIQGSRLLGKSYNILVQNVNVHVHHVSDGERLCKKARIAGAAEYDGSRLVTFARNSSLPRNCTDQHSFFGSNSIVAQPRLLGSFGNQSSFSPPMSNFDSLQFSSALESLPSSTNFAQPSAFVPFGSQLLPYVHALQANALASLHAFAPFELLPTNLYASTMLNSAYCMNTLGYIPRLQWDDGHGVISVSRNCVSWSARREPVESDE